MKISIFKFSNSNVFKLHANKNDNVDHVGNWRPPVGHQQDDGLPPAIVVGDVRCVNINIGSKAPQFAPLGEAEAKALKTLHLFFFNRYFNPTA